MEEWMWRGMMRTPDIKLDSLPVRADIAAAAQSELILRHTHEVDLAKPG